MRCFDAAGDLVPSGWKLLGVFLCRRSEVAYHDWFRLGDLVWEMSESDESELVSFGAAVDV